VLLRRPGLKDACSKEVPHPGALLWLVQLPRPPLSAPVCPEAVRPMHTSPTLAALESSALRTDLPDFRVGDTIRVHYRIVEGDKERTQVFQGVVIKRHRAGARSTFTVRKVSFSVGVERIFLSHSPRIEKVEVVSKGVVRRARLFYLRDLAGKAARVRDQKDL
jgi:large subunit ribosomal protein L19